MKLKEVNFTGTNNSNYIPITRDVGGLQYQAPQYVVDNVGNVITRYPVAYVSGTKAKVKAVFETSAISDRYIRGLGPNITGGQILFPSQKCSHESGKMTYKEIKADIEFTNNTVDYWDDFEIKWQFSTDNVNWVDMGTSKNQMYVTYKEPYIPSAYGWDIDGHGEETKAYHTILHLGCKNAEGQNTGNNVVDIIYNDGFKFVNNHDKVYRADGAGPIKYWGAPTSNPTIPEYYWKTSGLLQALSGTCGGWAVFYEDVLRIQGIKTSTISTVTYTEYVLSSSDLTKLDSDIKSFFGNEETNVKKLPPDVQGYTGTRSDFFVKKWNLNSTVPFVMNEYENSNPSDFTLANGKIIKVEEQTGASGQGNIDPRSEFENHAIVKYNNKYYDPSYGSAIANDANSWETPALDGFGSIVFYQKEAKKSYVNWVGHLNDTSPQAKIKP
ncbi:MAG TPA: hypothetical protein PLU49_11330 [Saprospiraceae bacterium]|nr:hypothetical protein [Saprospiraceae bacterium]